MIENRLSRHEGSGGGCGKICSDMTWASTIWTAWWLVDRGMGQNGVLNAAIEIYCPSVELSYPRPPFLRPKPSTMMETIKLITPGHSCVSVFPYIFVIYSWQEIIRAFDLWCLVIWCFDLQLVSPIKRIVIFHLKNRKRSSLQFSNRRTSNAASIIIIFFVIRSYLEGWKARG